MAFFRYNPNEVAYVGGKKHWTDVIKNSGPGEMLIWRQPEEDFNTNSTLVVMPGEQAFFVNGGVVEQVFEESGTYKLNTQNYPFISRLRNSFSGGISTFNCIIYFVRKAHSAEIFWGTSSPLQVRDKLLGIATKMKARGSYKVSVENPVLFMEKLVGNNVSFQSQEDLNRYFMNEMQMGIRSTLTKFLNTIKIELLGIEEYIVQIADAVYPLIQKMLEEYGLKCEKFVIAALEIDDDELRRRYDEIGMEKIDKLRNATADSEVVDTLGEKWKILQAASILKDLANNPGAGGVAAGGAGIGMGIAAADIFGVLAQQLMAPMNLDNTQRTSTPSDSRWTVGPGRYSVKKNATEKRRENDESKRSPVEVLGELKQMLDMGFITKEEYEIKKKEVLSRM